MFDVKKQLAVQSWCFRNFKSTTTLIEQIKGIRLKRVELCGVHADFNDPAKFPSLLEPFKQAGLQIASIGVQTFTGDEAKETAWFEFARQAGCRMISAAFDPFKQPECFTVAEKLAEKFDINLGIHNHGAHDWLGSVQMLNYILQRTGRRIGLCLDTAWMLDAGGNPVEVAEKFRDRLYGVHIKDFIFDRAGTPKDVVVGKGNLDLPALMRLIADTGHCSSVTLEYEGDVENPAPKLKACLRKIRAAAAPPAAPAAA